MKTARLLVVPMLLVAALSLTGCGAGSLKLGQSAEVDLSLVGKAGSVFEVTVSSLTPAPEEVAAKYDTEDKLYFATVEAKLKDPSKATGLVSGVYSNVYAQLSDGNYLNMSGSGPDECPGRPADATQASNDFKAGKTVSVCVPLSADGEKDVVGVYVGTADVNSGKGKVWAKS